MLAIFCKATLYFASW